MPTMALLLLLPNHQQESPARGRPFRYGTFTNGALDDSASTTALLTALHAFPNGDNGSTNDYTSEDNGVSQAHKRQQV